MADTLAALTNDQLRAVIDEAEKVFSTCRDDLERDLGGREGILGFQPKLARTIYDLESQILRVKRAERALVRAKRSYEPTELASRFRTMHSQVTALERVIDLGMLLGDAFVWMFYRSTPQLLRNHYTHERVGHLPVGTGGVGEIAFIENTPLVGHHLVLYHGITTCLRLGDVSLFNLRTGKIDGIAELKTRQVAENRVEIAINYCGQKLNLPDPIAGADRMPRPNHQQKFAAVLERQMKAIQRAIEPRSTPKLKRGETTVLLAPESLAELYDRSGEQKWAAMQVSAGLVVAGVKVRGSSLADRLLSADQFDPTTMDETLLEVRKIVVPGARDNTIEIGTLVFPGGGRYHLKYGMKPLRWWPLRKDVRHAIADGRFVVITFFNPASLLARFRARGYEVRSVRKGRGFTLHIEKPERPFAFGPLDHFFELIPERMMQEDSVFHAICNIIDRFDAQHPDANAKIGLELLFESLEPGERPSSE